MSIRSKLFLAFILAAALPLAVVGELAHLYLERAQVDVEQRFADSARLAFRDLRADGNKRFEELKLAIRRLTEDGLTMTPSDLLPELKLLPHNWPRDAEGERRLDEILKAHHLAEKSAKRIRQQVMTRVAVIERDEAATAAAVKELRAAHPEVLGVKIELAGENLYNDLPRDFDFPDAKSSEQTDSSSREPFLVKAADGRELLAVVLLEELTSVFVQIDREALVPPAPFMGAGRVFYLGKDGSVAGGGRALADQLPLRELAMRLPPRATISLAGAEWEVYRAPDAERDPWGFGGEAQLVAAAPRAVIEAPIVRFRREVWAAALVSILVAVSLSYFLSGRFTESVENLKRGVDALSRGEFERLQKSSGDELGGELVDSMNRMASALAERTRKEEIENWRRLVRVLSHEINNTLGPVKSVATTVRDQIAKQVEAEAGAETAEDLRSAFRLIVDRVDSLSSFISGYAVLAKLPPPERAPTDVAEVVRGALSMMKEPAHARGLTIEERCAPDLGSPEIDKLQIERVIINLVKNAVEAAASRVVVRGQRRGDMVELSVEDDGPGISAAARASLFVPYFSTKPGGSGIGLALARQIVLGHGGSIGSEDLPGGGTVFRVVLPVGGLI